MSTFGRMAVTGLGMVVDIQLYACVKTVELDVRE